MECLPKDEHGSHRLPHSRRFGGDNRSSNWDPSHPVIPLTKQKTAQSLDRFQVVDFLIIHLEELLAIDLNADGEIAVWIRPDSVAVPVITRARNVAPILP
jgi:hypothetical protein